MKIYLPLTPLTETFTREEGEYYAYHADQDTIEMLETEIKRPGLLFTEHQIKEAFKRWCREGMPQFVDEVEKVKAEMEIELKKRDRTIKRLRRLVKKLYWQAAFQPKPRPRRGWGWLWRLITIR